MDDRPEEPVASGADIEALCAGLAGLQREGCVTAASVVGPVDPAAQLGICSELRGADVTSCIHGTKVQNLIDRPLSTYVGLIDGCDVFAQPVRAECYRWLGKTLAVLTDGEFGRSGCSQLGAAARRECEAGAATIDEALVTFS